VVWEKSGSRQYGYALVFSSINHLLWGRWESSVLEIVVPGGCESVVFGAGGGGWVGGCVSGIQRKQIEILLHDFGVEASELTDSRRVGGDTSQDADGFEVPDVPVDGVFRVAGFSSDVRGITSLEVEGDDFPFVGDVTGEVVDIPASREKTAGGALVVVDVIADDAVTDVEEDGQVELAQEGSLIEGLIDPADHTADSEFSGSETVPDGLDVFIGEEGQDDQFHGDVLDSLASFGSFLDGDGGPGHLAVLEEDTVLIGPADEEVSFDELKEVFDDSPSGDFPLLVAVVVEKPVQQHLLEGFVVDPAEFLVPDLLGGQGPIITSGKIHRWPPFSAVAGSTRSARRSFF
jgi:hypothetical protein